MTMAFIECRHLERTFYSGGQPLHALRGVDLQINRGELVSIIGASGAGKSTLLNAIGGLDRPTRGDVLIDGQSLAAMSEPELASFRSRTIGFVFQQFNLLPRHDALRSVELPLVYAGWLRQLRRTRATDLLTRLGLQQHLSKRPTHMSGGQQQRVAIARALANAPKLLLADEPTGALDSKTGAEVMQLLIEMNREHGLTVVIVTHNGGVSAQCDRTVIFCDGHIVGDQRRVRS